MKDPSSNSRAGLLVAGLAALTGAWLWLQAPLPVWAWADATRDDQLFVRQALGLVNGTWLGPYDSLTLAKAPFYPAFVAAAHQLHVPLLLAQRLLLALAAALAVLALKPLVPSRPVRAALFVLLLLNPVVVTRVVREGIYPALTLALLASFVGLLTRRDEPLRALAGWATAAGVSLSAFWLTREEGVWIVPALGLLAAAALVSLARRHRLSRPLLLRGALVLSPAFALLASLAGVALKNRSAYGASTTTAVADGVSVPFTTAYGALTRVEPLRRNVRVPVAAEVRRSIYRVSPAFHLLEPFLEGSLGQAWQLVSCRELPDTCGEIAGGWFPWALRDAAAAAGIYESAPDAEEYYRRLAAEVNGGCNLGLLTCGPARDTVAPPGLRGALGAALRSLPLGVSALLSAPRDATAEALAARSFGSDDWLDAFRLATREPLAPVLPADARTRVRGWISGRASGPLGLRLREGGVMVRPGTVRLLQGAGPGKTGFELVAFCAGRGELEVVRGSETLLRAALDPPGRADHIEGSGLRLHLAAVQRPSAADTSARAGSARFRLAVVSGIASGYAAAGPFLAALAGLLFLGALVVPRAWNGGGGRVLVMTALLVAIVCRLVLLAIVHVTSFAALHEVYLSAVYPLLLVFVGLAVLPVLGGLARGFRNPAAGPPRTIR